MKSTISTLLHKTKRRLKPPPHPSLTTPTVQAILSGSAAHPHWDDLQTPLERLYLMYHLFVLGDTSRLTTIIKSFFYTPNWPVKDIPDPQDANPERYAILAVIPFWLCEAFNRNIGKGLHRDTPPIVDNEMLAKLEARPKRYEEVPRWTKNVPALGEKLVIPGSGGGGPEERYLCPELGRLGVVAEKLNVFFI